MFNPKTRIAINVILNIIKITHVGILINNCSIWIEGVVHLCSNRHVISHRAPDSKVPDMMSLCDNAGAYLTVAKRAIVQSGQITSY